MSVIHTAIEASNAIVAAPPQAPNITWTPDPELKKWAARGAFVVALVWIVFAVAQFVIPSRRAGGLGRGGAGKFIGVAVVIILLMDLDLVPLVINNILNLVWYFFDLVGIV